MSKDKTLPLFVIDRAATIKWPVIVRIPVDGGEFASYQFTAVFKHLPEDEYDAIMNAKVLKAIPGDAPKIDAVPGNTRADTLRENAELLPQLMTGWEGVRDSSGATIEFTADMLRKQIVGVNGAYLSSGLWTALAEIRNGARLGN